MSLRLSVYGQGLHDHSLLSVLAESCLADQVEQRTPDTADFLGDLVEVSPLFAAVCEAAELDYALLPANCRFADFGLLVSDMDSTLIEVECIDELADMLGIKAQVAAITERSMRGELDFAASLKERVALLKGLPASALDEVYEQRIRLTRGAETLLAACQQHQVKFLLISGGFTFFTERLKQRLGLDYAVANTLEIVDGHLTGRILGPIIDAQAKADYLHRTADELGLSSAQTLAIGDGANDLKMIAAAALGIAFHAKPVVAEQADMAIRFGGLEALPKLLG